MPYRVCFLLAALQLFRSCNGFASIRPELRLGQKSLTLKFSESDDTVTASNSDMPKKKKLSRPERKALERQKKQQAPVTEKRNQARAKYGLHSNAVSELTLESGPEDVLRAIKRAHNLYDIHDIRVIGSFLLDECGVDFAYGFRGSLLARLAVAALHVGNHEVARRAIAVRRVEYRSSMLPMESAAIIRGLLRTKNATEAMEVLHDELKLPLQVRCVLLKNWSSHVFLNN